MVTPWEQSEHQYDTHRRRIPPAIRFQTTHPDAKMPTCQHVGDAGYDFYTVGSTRITPGEWQDVPTGLHLELPAGYWLRLVGRSSTFRRRGLLVIEGVVDNGYRGEIFFGVWNRTGEPVTIEAGER